MGEDVLVEGAAARVPDAYHTVRYPVVEHFYTVQGEGAWAGHAAYFVRLGGCDVLCPWCDTKESWPMEGHQSLTVAEMLAEITATPAPIVVITGGEPTLHDMHPLAEAVRAAGRRVHLETSGAHPIRGTFDWVTLSPKKFKPPDPSVYAHVDELKIVVVNRHDFKWAEEHAARCSAGVGLLLQPEWSTPRLVPEIVEFVKRHPRWRVSVQTHKYLQVP